IEHGGKLQDRRNQNERTEHRETNRERNQVSGPHTTVSEEANVDQGLTNAEFDDYEHNESDDAEHEQADGLGVIPAPAATLADREQERSQSDGKDSGPNQVEATRGTDGRLWHPEDCAQQCDHDQDGREP